MGAHATSTQIDLAADAPARRVRVTLELTELAEKMLVQRWLREGATDDEARARLAAWRSGAGTHADDAWFVPRRTPASP